MNLPTSRAEQLRAAHGLEAELTQSLGRAPTLGELADALGRSEDWTAGLLAHQRPRSLELVDGSTLERLPASDELEEVLAEPLQVRELLFRLDDLDRRWSPGHSHTQRECFKSQSPGSAASRRGRWRRCAASARGRPQLGSDPMRRPTRAQWPGGE